MPFLVYSALRVGLLAVVLALLWWAGMRGWLLVVVASLGTGALSYLLLAGPRDAAARQIAEHVERRRRTGERFSRAVEDDAAAEDALVDEQVRSDRQTDAQQQAEGQLQHPRPGQDGDQGPASGTDEHRQREQERR